MKTNEKKNKHMLLEDRIEIQECITKGITFKEIAKRIGKDPTTVSKEVKLHAESYRNSFTKTDECCPKLMKAPFVCNGCEKRNHSNCPFVRRVYRAKTAQKEYETVLTESREGIPLNKEEFYRTEEIISDAVRNGQHVYHAIQSNDVPVSTATVYRHISLGYYSISKVDLPRAAKFKERKKPKGEYVPKGVKIGRSYEDFLAFTEDNPKISITEMDTVIGRVGGKVIMTFQFNSVDFMFGLLLENKTAAEASAKIIALKKRLNDAEINFADLIPLLLTDNGGEFSNVFAFEQDKNGNVESRVFFCDPNSPYQKPHVEHNHTLFRDIVPSGTSFDEFTQEDVNIIFSHVNAVKRKQFHGKSAYDMFAFTFSQETALLLGIQFIPAEEVIQTPKLLKLLPSKKS